MLEVERDGLRPLVPDLGGHDLADITRALAEARAERDRPTVIFAYTIKGYGLPIAGRPQNHSALLSPDQIDALRAESGPRARRRVGLLRPRLARGEGLRRGCGERLAPAGSRAGPLESRCRPRFGRRSAARTSTQAAFGRIVLELSRSEGSRNGS